MLFGRFLYTDDAGGEGGNAGGAGHQTPQPAMTLEQFKEYGIENPEQLQIILQQHKESKVSAADKKKQADEQEAELINFSVKENLMNADEYQQAKTIKTRNDRELRFEKYAQEWREDHPEITDPEDIEAGIKEDFENEYRVNSENAKLKARGEARLAKEASEIRNPLVEKLTVAEQRFTERKAMAGKMPEFNKFVDTLIEELTPEKLVVSKVKEGDAEISIEVELSKEERTELAKAFRTPKTFAAFASAKDPSKELKDSLAKKMTGFIRERHFEKAITTTFGKGKEIGLAQGSTVGAGQPFAVIKGGHQDNTGKAPASVRQEIIASTRAKTS
jgi:hypothetical protein